MHANMIFTFSKPIIPRKNSDFFSDFLFVLAWRVALIAFPIFPMRRSSNSVRGSSGKSLFRCGGSSYSSKTWRLRGRGHVAFMVAIRELW